jgi:predicted ATPase with chaperone activity
VLTSEQAAAQVERARARQRDRWGGVLLNGDITGVRDTRLAMSSGARAELESLVEQDPAGGRIQRAVIRVSRTIADLDDRDEVSCDDVLGAWDLTRNVMGGGVDG